MNKIVSAERSAKKKRGLRESDGSMVRNSLRSGEGRGEAGEGESLAPGALGPQGRVQALFSEGSPEGPRTGQEEANKSQLGKRVGGARNRAPHRGCLTNHTMCFSPLPRLSFQKLKITNCCFSL